MTADTTYLWVVVPEPYLVSILPDVQLWVVSAPLGGDRFATPEMGFDGPSPQGSNRASRRSQEAYSSTFAIPQGPCDGRPDGQRSAVPDGPLCDFHSRRLLRSPRVVRSVRAQHSSGRSLIYIGPGAWRSTAQSASRFGWTLANGNGGCPVTSMVIHAHRRYGWSVGFPKWSW